MDSRWCQKRAVPQHPTVGTAWLQLLRRPHRQHRQGTWARARSTCPPQLICSGEIVTLAGCCSSPCALLCFLSNIALHSKTSIDSALWNTLATRCPKVVPGTATASLSLTLAAPPAICSTPQLLNLRFDSALHLLPSRRPRILIALPGLPYSIFCSFSACFGWYSPTEPRRTRAIMTMPDPLPAIPDPS